MPTIRLPHIAEGSIDVGGQRVPVVNHLVTVPLAQLGPVLRGQPDAEIVSVEDAPAGEEQ